MTYQETVVILNDFMTSQSITKHSPMSADNVLIEQIGDYLSFKDKEIVVLPIETSSKLILGKLRHFPKRVEILLNETLNPCWTRFVLVKELMHLVMSKDGEGLTKNIDELIEGLYNASFGYSDELDHEYLAILFAADYMLPYALTQAKMKDPSILPAQIADEFKVPKNIVDLLSTATHLAMRDEAYKDTDIEHEVIVPQ